MRLSRSDSDDKTREYDEWLCSIGNGTGPKSHCSAVELPVINTSLIEPKTRTNVMRQAIHWVFGDALEVII